MKIHIQVLICVFVFNALGKYLGVGLLGCVVSGTNCATNGPSVSPSG